MRRVFLKEHLPIQYNKMLLTEQLFPHLREVSEKWNAKRKDILGEVLVGGCCRGIYNPLSESPHAEMKVVCRGVPAVLFGDHKGIAYILDFTQVGDAVAPVEDKVNLRLRLRICCEKRVYF
ncbi:MAG: TnpV protein [Clostridiales Family XIII bacterium]|jgi:hypothetical protein|nr:TnpV protein [Clostridiales Family XIII bacterium]